MTDAEFVLDCLRRGGWWSLNDLLRASLAVRGCGLTVHSRVSDLRAAGHVVEHRMVGRRGDGSQYRLLTERGSAEGARSRSSSAVADHAPYGSPGAVQPRSVSVPVQLALVPEQPRGAYHKDAA